MGTLLESLSKSTVVTALHISEFLLLLAGLVLLVGIWGEYAKSDRWKKHLAVFQIMVLAGIGGELIADAGVFLFSESLQRLEGSDIQALDRKSRDAREKAIDAINKSNTALALSGTAGTAAKEAVEKSDKAARSASNAMTLASGARQEADSFERDIVSAKKQAAEAEAHLAEALKRAQNTEANVLKLRQDSAPRRLTEEQKNELVKLLSTAPTFTVIFDPLRSSLKEPADFMNDLMDVFVRMKLLSPGSNSNTPGHAIGGTDSRGVTVGVMSSTEHPRAAELFIMALQKWGFEVTGEAGSNIVKSPTEMRILVSPKQ